MVSGPGRSYNFTFINLKVKIKVMVKIQYQKNRYSITIPKTLIEICNWEKGDQVTFERISDDKFLIENTDHETEETISLDSLKEKLDIDG